MKAMVVRAPGGTDVLKMETIADPTPGPKDVVIKVDACGVCFHDIVTRNGTLKFGVQMPLILGHEISGTVVDVGRDVRGFKTGDKVATVQRYHICGSCRHCRMGKETLCPDRKFTGDAGMVGGYAEYIAVEDDNVAIVPAGVATSVNRSRAVSWRCPLSTTPTTRASTSECWRSTSSGFNV